jgi:hypothetical protein
MPIGDSLKSLDHGRDPDVINASAAGLSQCYNISA